MPGPDNMYYVVRDWNYPYESGAAVVPSDTVALAHTARGIYVGGIGDVTVITETGDTLLFKAVSVGAILPVRAAYVKATGTTATNLLALW